MDKSLCKVEVLTTLSFYCNLLILSTILSHKLPSFCYPEGSQLSNKENLPKQFIIKAIKHLKDNYT